MMKKYIIKTFTLCILLFVLQNGVLFHQVFAIDPDVRDGTAGGQTSGQTSGQTGSQTTIPNLDITSDNFVDEFKPGKKDSATTNNLSSPFINTIIQVVNPVLGIIQVIGGILSVVSIAFFGITMMLSSTDIASALFDNIPSETPEARVELLKFLKYVMIGTVLLTASATIAKVVFNVLYI